jgi:hypothetical protein
VSTKLGAIHIVRIVISLSADYEGDDFKHSYAIDPTKGQEFSVDFDLNFDESEVRKIYEYQFYDSQVALDCLHAVLPQEIQRQQEQHLEEVLANSREAMERRFAGSEHVDPDEFIEAYVESLTPYINHLAKAGRIRHK